MGEFGSAFELDQSSRKIEIGKKDRRTCRVMFGGGSLERRSLKVVVLEKEKGTNEMVSLNDARTCRTERRD